MGQVRDWRTDPRLAEEYTARQQEINRRRLAQQAELGEVQAQGIADLGDAASSTIKGGVDGYQKGREFGAEQEAHQRRMELSEEDMANSQVMRPLAQRHQELENAKSEEQLRQMQTPKQAGLTPFQQQTLDLQKQRLGLDRERMSKSGTAEAKPVLIQTLDDEGKPVKRFVVPKEGQEYASQTLASKPLPAASQQRLDNAAMALLGVEDMNAAFNSGENTFSVIGDNKFTEAKRRFTEALGRMQSGGAINKEEEKRFSSMIPTAADPEPLQRLKLKKMANEMAARIKSFGMDPQKVIGERKNQDYPLAGATPTSGAIAAPSAKAVKEMTDAEIDAELATYGNQ